MGNGKKRILIIDDDEGMRSLLEDFFEEEGYETESVENGAEALHKLDGENFDLIITDLRMPGLSGLDILPGLRRLQPEAFIVLYTAFGSEEVYRKAFAKGANACLEKSFYFKKLINLIERAASMPRPNLLRGAVPLEGPADKKERG